MRFIFLCVCFFVSFACYSQITGTLYNELNLPVENASVFLLKDKDTLHTTISDKNGFFEFNNFSDKEDFVLIASHIGYETLRTRPAKEKIYFLVSKQYLLNKVDISSEIKEKKSFVNRILGTIINITTHFSYGVECATFIPATDRNKGKKIKSLKYQLADEFELKNNKYQPFRACIYTVDTITKKPKEKIYRSEKVRMTKNQKWFYVHIDSLDITMPKEGLFVAFEALTREEAHNKQVGSRDGGLVDAILPSLRGKVYNPNNPNKSYVKHFVYSGEISHWELYRTSHFYMEFEFED